MSSSILNFGHDDKQTCATTVLDKMPETHPRDKRYRKTGKYTYNRKLTDYETKAIKNKAIIRGIIDTMCDDICFNEYVSVFRNMSGDIYVG